MRSSDALLTTLSAWSRIINRQRIKSESRSSALMSSCSLRTLIETRIPSAFATYIPPKLRTILTGISEIDSMSGGVPVSGLTEICGMGKTSVLVSLLAHASHEHYCALVDATDTLDTVAAEAAGTDFSRLLWVRCGKTKQKLRPLEQAFKVADMLLQSSGFGLIAVDLGGLAEKLIRNVPISTWFRFSRVVENKPTLLVFFEQPPYATSCADLVLRLTSAPAVFSGQILTNFNFKAETIRTREKKTVQPVRDFSIKAQWA